ncbi:Dolichyl-phosphate-mannose-protein mannosyltransferase [Entomobacter blattae]|uniref:Dolichyl-phosphate-mannose-protein mannosyltransferase n=2 Tax=Entomobacter blattae TaxID=2762277 RepID=A0A7H1NNL4_9PROT|nr:Dolichyl-phosphate-mannose-protein mannosyltransferase [Entomobacter blattae]
MVALWIWLGEHCVGSTFLGIRFLSPLSVVVGSLFLASAVRGFHNPLLKEVGLSKGSGISKSALACIYIYNSILAVGIGAVTITPDTALLFFVCVFVWACSHLRGKPTPFWWIVTGFVAGCAMDSKYTASLLIMGLVGWCLLTRVGRQHIKTPWPWCGALVSIIAFSPTLLWNAQHGWASLARQAGRAGNWAPINALRFSFELVMGQIGLITPLLFMGFCIAFSRAFSRQAEGRDGNKMLLWLGIIPIIVFIQHALGDRVQANWPTVVYPVGVVLLAMIGWKATRMACLLALFLIVPVYLQAGYSVWAIPRKFDISLKQLGGWQEWAMQLAARQPAFIATDDYGDAAELAYYLPHAIQVVGIDPRWQYFRLSACTVRGQGLFVQNIKRREPPDSRIFSDKILQGTMVRQKQGRIAETYRIYQVAIAPSITDEAKKTMGCLKG